MGEAKKDDAGKLRYDLIPPDALREVALVYTIGADKYGDNNYLGGLNYSRVIGAMMRHLEAFRCRESYDPDGQHHLASVAWFALTLIAYEQRGLGTDDRPYLTLSEKLNVEAAKLQTTVIKEVPSDGQFRQY